MKYLPYYARNLSKLHIRFLFFIYFLLDNDRVFERQKKKLPKIEATDEKQQYVCVNLIVGQCYTLLKSSLLRTNNFVNMQ